MVDNCTDAVDASVPIKNHPDKIAVGAVWPGFDDSRASWSQNRHIANRCGKTFEEGLRLFRRYYGGDNVPPYLLIETWNDYEEGTAIERGINACKQSGNEPPSAVVGDQ